jgi:hypothetical protein
VNFFINIFDHDIFPSHIFAEVLYDSLKTCHIIEDKADYSPQMEKVLIDVLHTVCNKTGQSWTDFDRNLDEYLAENQNSIPMLAQTIISIKNRLRRFTGGLLSNLFKFDSNKDRISTILNKNVVIDLGYIFNLGGSKEDIIFYANLILKWIWQHNMMKEPTDQLQHITIFEDVSYIASKKILEQSKLTTYLEDITLLLRGKGEALISLTTTLEISRNMLLNSGTKFIFKFNEKNTDVYSLFGLDVEIDINLLNLGYCLVKTDSIPTVFLISMGRMMKRAKKKVNLKKKMKESTSIIKPMTLSKSENDETEVIQKEKLNQNLIEISKKISDSIIKLKKFLFSKKETEMAEEAINIAKLVEIAQEIIIKDKNLQKIHSLELKALNQIYYQLNRQIDSFTCRNYDEIFIKVDLFVRYLKFFDKIYMIKKDPVKKLSDLNSDENLENKIKQNRKLNYDIQYKMIYDIDNREQDVFFEYGQNFRDKAIILEKNRISKVWTEFIFENSKYLIHKIQLNSELNRNQKMILYSIFSFQEGLDQDEVIIDYLKRSYEYLIKNILYKNQIHKIIQFNKEVDPERQKMKDGNYFIKIMIRDFIIQVNEFFKKIFDIEKRSHHYQNSLNEITNLQLLFTKLIIQEAFEKRTIKQIN